MASRSTGIAINSQRHLGPDQAASLAVDASDRHRPRALCHSTALQAALLNERVRSPEELHPVSAPNAGLGMGPEQFACA